MKRLRMFLIIFCFLILIAILIKTGKAMPSHWIVGLVNDAGDGEPADGHIIIIYHPEDRTDNETDIIGPSGNSGTGNRYMIDCESLDTSCQVGDTISIEVLDSGDNYKSDQVNVTISGAGYDIAPDLTLEKQIIVELNFTTNSIDWGSGSIDSGVVRAVLDLFAGTVENGSWGAQSNGLVLENIGNVGVKLELVSNKNASSFIGRGAPEENEDFEWKIVNTTASCNETFNNTDFDNVAVINYRQICPEFFYNDTKDNVTIYFKVIIPSDTSKSGGQTAIITARGTQIV